MNLPAASSGELTPNEIRKENIPIVSLKFWNQILTKKRFDLMAELLRDIIETSK